MDKPAGKEASKQASKQTRAQNHEEEDAGDKNIVGDDGDNVTKCVTATRICEARKRRQPLLVRL